MGKSETEESNGNRGSGLKVKEWTNLKQKSHMVVQVTDRKYEASGLRNLEDQKQKQDDHMVNVENVEN